MDLDQLLRDLAQVTTQLSELPEDAFEQRFQLRQRQDELRAKSREMLAQTGDLLSADEVRTHLEQLKKRREAFLDGTRLSHAAAAQTGQGGGIDPKYVHDMHRQMDAAFDLAGLNAEIDRLEHRLSELEPTD